MKKITLFLTLFSILNFCSNKIIAQCGQGETPVNFSAMGAVTQTWTVPTGVTSIKITARGADGGDAVNQSKKGGEGATISAEFNVTAGDELELVVGEAGTSEDNCGGGGGGSGVRNNTTNTLLIVAGGGGGAGDEEDGIGGTNNPTAAAGTIDGIAPFPPAGMGGTNGNGGEGGASAGGGGINSAGEENPPAPEAGGGGFSGYGGLGADVDGNYNGVNNSRLRAVREDENNKNNSSLSIINPSFGGNGGYGVGGGAGGYDYSQNGIFGGIGGGGGGFSGGGGGSLSVIPEFNGGSGGGGASTVDVSTTSTSATATAGGTGAGLKMDGSVTICYVISLPSITISVVPASDSETNGELIYTFTRSGSIANLLTANFSLSNTSTATLSSDYSITTGAGISFVNGNDYTVTFGVGESTKTMTATIMSDTDIEGDETIVFKVETGTGYNVGSPDMATGTIEDDDHPTVTSITRVDANPTNAAAVNFKVLFSHAVAGVDAGDFMIDASGVTANIGNITGTTNCYNVEVNTVTGDGTLGLDLIDDNSIHTNSQALGGDATADGNFTTGETYEVDRVAPTVVSFTRKIPTAAYTNADMLSFLATFNETVTGVAADDFVVTGTTADITVTNPQTSTFCIELSGGDLADLTATVGLNFATTATIQDVIGNNFVVAEPTPDETYDVDNSDPVTTTLMPADDATGVTVTTNLVMTFDENIQKGTGNIVIRLSDDDSAVETIDVTSGQVTINGMTATINPNMDLAQSTDYYVEVDNGSFEDVLGNDFAGISGNSTWNFQTFIPSITLAIQGAAAVGESSGTGIVYQFTRNGLTTEDITINYSISSSVGAAMNADFMVTTDANTTYNLGMMTGTIKILAGDTSADLTITPVGDGMVETNEEIVVKIEPFVP